MKSDANTLLKVIDGSDAAIDRRVALRSVLSLWPAGDETSSKSPRRAMECGNAGIITQVVRL